MTDPTLAELEFRSALHSAMRTRPPQDEAERIVWAGLDTAVDLAFQVMVAEVRDGAVGALKAM